MGDPISIQKIKDAGFVNVRDNDNDHKLSSSDHIELPATLYRRDRSEKISPEYAAVIYRNHQTYLKTKSQFHPAGLKQAVSNYHIAGEILMPKADPKRLDHYIYEINYVGSLGRTQKAWVYPNAIEDGKATLQIEGKQIVLDLAEKQSEWCGRAIEFENNGLRMSVYRCTLHPRYVNWKSATKTNGDMRKLILEIYEANSIKCKTGRG
ncbi:hypothetical protein ACFL6C_12545 [Myxococcota bacterium]